MREHLKNDLLAALYTKMTDEQLSMIEHAFDTVSIQYDVKRVEMHLTVVGREDFVQLIRTFLAAKKMEGLSQKTLERYSLVLEHYMMATIKPVAEITANDIRAWLFCYQSERGVSNRTLDGMRSAICSFFRWAACEEYIPRNPAASVKPIKYMVPPRRAVTQTELEMLRRGCRDKRELAILETLYSTGCRVSELCGIKLGDVNWVTREVRVLGKGSKYRMTYLNAKAEVALKEYLHERKYDSVYLISRERAPSGPIKKDNVERIIKGIAARAGMGDRHITPHVFRHTTATQALRSGMPVEEIQRLLGHSSVATTMIYAEVVDESVRNRHQICVV